VLAWHFFPPSSLLHSLFIYSPPSSFPSLSFLSISGPGVPSPNSAGEARGALSASPADPGGTRPTNGLCCIPSWKCRSPWQCCYRSFQIIRYKLWPVLKWRYNFEPAKEGRRQLWGTGHVSPSTFNDKMSSPHFITDSIRFPRRTISRCLESTQIVFAREPRTPLGGEHTGRPHALCLEKRTLLPIPHPLGPLPSTRQHPSYGDYL